MPEKTENTFGYWKRLLAGTLMVLVAAVAATTAFGIDEYDKVVNALIEGKKIEGIDRVIAQAEEGKPQTLLLIGSDTIGKGESELGRETARSDTIILLRLDPESGATALMSLPRDLRVNIPGYGTDKLNAAFAFGGAKLTTETVKAVTGLPINHVVNIDFNGFVDVIDKLGCVYTDVDRRYFYEGLDYANINLVPGYQRLCGTQALSFARYRHEDTDIVRGARQQDFLRSFKSQIGVDKLFSQREELIKIFRNNTESDIADRDSARNLLELALASATKPVQEIHFEGELGASEVTASDQQMRQMTADFLGIKASSGPRGTLEPEGTATDAVGNPDGPSRSELRANRRASAKAKRNVDGKGQAPAEQKLATVEDATLEGETQAQQAKAAGADFPVCYPTLRTPGAVYAGEPHVYKIGVGPQGSPDRQRFSSYRMVLKRGNIGEYYGLQGTTWRDAKADPSDPPILNEPHTTKQVNGRDFDLYYDGDRLRLVAWRTSKGTYWLSNTLLQTLSAREMLKIAGNTECL